MVEDQIGREVVDTAVQIHRGLGHGLLESVYEAVLAYELRKRGLEVDRQVVIPLEYQGLKFEEGFRADLLVERKVIIEIKCAERLSNAHRKQLLTYLRLANLKLGYLLNFGEVLMKDGIVRTAYHLPEQTL